MSRKLSSIRDLLFTGSRNPILARSRSGSQTPMLVRRRAGSNNLMLTRSRAGSNNLILARSRTGSHNPMFARCRSGSQNLMLVSNRSSSHTPILARSQTGSALVWVLWLLLLFSILGLALINLSLLETRMQVYNRSALQAELAADAAVEIALAHLEQQLGDAYSTTQTLPAQLSPAGNPFIIDSGPPPVKAMVSPISISSGGIRDEHGNETVYTCSFTATGLYREAEKRSGVQAACRFSNHYQEEEGVFTWQYRALEAIEVRQCLMGYH